MIMEKERKTKMGMNKREYQQKIDELENLLKIYRDHLGFEKSKSEGFKASIGDKKKIIGDHVAEIQSMQLLIDRYSDRVDILEEKFKFVSDRLTQYQKELAADYKNADGDATEQLKIESKMKAIAVAKELLEL